MFTTRALRQAAQHAERTPLIKFVGKRTIPASIDHSPQPHPASPSGSLPGDFTSGASQSSHSSFSSYRDHAQQFGPLRKTIKSNGGPPGIGGSSGAELGPVDAISRPAGRLQRQPISAAEIEFVESGGATAFA